MKAKRTTERGVKYKIGRNMNKQEGRGKGEMA